MKKEIEVTEEMTSEEISAELDQWYEDNRPSNPVDWNLKGEADEIESAAFILSNSLIHTEMLVDMYAQKNNWHIHEEDIAEIYSGSMNIVLDFHDELIEDEDAAYMSGLLYLCKYASQMYDYVPDEIPEEDLYEIITHFIPDDEVMVKKTKKLDKSLN